VTYIGTRFMSEFAKIAQGSKENSIRKTGKRENARGPRRPWLHEQTRKHQKKNPSTGKLTGRAQDPEKKRWRSGLWGKARPEPKTCSIRPQKSTTQKKKIRAKILCKTMSYVTPKKGREKLAKKKNGADYSYLAKKRSPL